MNDQHNMDRNVSLRAIATCSGASLAGHLADLTARKLAQQKNGRMICLAGVSARIPEILAGLERATAILVIDGCPRKCAKHTLEDAGFTRVRHFCISDIDTDIVPETAAEEALLVNFLAPRAGEILRFGENPIIVTAGNCCEH